MVQTSKVKSKLLMCAGLLLVFFFLVPMVWAQDIFIDSGVDQDTQILVGPHAGTQGGLDDLTLESGPGNDTFLFVTPTPDYPDSDPDIETIIITPEIFLKEK